MADQVPFLESVVLEDPHGYEQVGGHRAVEVDVAQLRRSHPVEGTTIMHRRLGLLLRWLPVEVRNAIGFAGVR